MRRLVALLLFLVACGPAPNTPHVSKEPISVRGWIVDVAGVPHGANAELDAVRRLQQFQATNVWIDDAPYVSGGVAENGSFLMLDVPPGNTTITFSAPGAPSAKLSLKNIPGNADVFIPGVLLKGDSVALLQPNAVTVRIAAHVDRPTPTGATATVAGLGVPVVNAPVASMADRHDYPNPPTAVRPVATFK
jgi:hypothetical protein